VIDAVDDVTRSVMSWVERALPKTPVEVRSLGDPASVNGVAIRLVEVAPLSLPRAERAPLLLRLDYLVSVHLADPLAEHRAIGELVFSALDHPDIVVGAAADLAALRERLDLPAGANLLVSKRLPRERAERPRPIVRRPLDIHVEPASPLEGIVVGPNDFPVVDAVVELPTLNLSALTNLQGRFRFAAAPSGTTPIRLTARKRQTQIEVDVVPGHPLTIRLPLEG
jgi:hypothetical protein